jgi:2-amino-4-hydroxy-6-hydroxymethyldihydropteridine diphosphokinase
MASAYFGLGSNLGSKTTNLRLAVTALSGLGTIATVSPLYSTEPVGYADQDWFLNACLALDTDLAPDQLLTGISEIEACLGRERTIPNGPRNIDIDLLFYDDLVVDIPDLTVPHPRLHERRFVLEPLAAIAPELVHPRLGKTIAELLAGVPAQPAVQLAQDGEWWR